MALVPIWSVYWPNAERTGPDLEQMNRVIEVDEEVARMRAGNRFGDLPGDGTARWPTPEELADWEAQKAVEEKADEAAAEGSLTDLKRDELLALLTDEQRAELPPRATKADIAAVIEQARADSATPASTDTSAAAPSAPNAAPDAAPAE
jgi:hypothetical protein